MTDLSNTPLSVCHKDTPPVSTQEAQQLLQQLPDWRLQEIDGEAQIQREYRLKNFNQALAFANTIGALADEADHHPALRVEWGKLGVSWWTHSIGGLHMNDFIMAARCDQAYQALEQN